MSRAWAIIAGALLLAAASPARAGDYDVDNTEWNGLGMFTSLASGAGYKVESSTSIDWAELQPDDVLVIVYPTNYLEPFKLAGFLQSGGRVILADDFGESKRALQELRIIREAAAGRIRAKYYNNRSFAPIATPKSKGHPLANNVEELTTNEPAVYTSVEGHTTVFGFEGDMGLVVAGELGRGRFVAIADPSVLINRMLQFKGNMQFAINLLNYFRDDDKGAGRLVILHSGFTMTGEPPVPKGGSVSSLLDQFNRWLLDRNDYLLTADATRAVGILAALIVALLGLAALPLLRRTGLDGSWTRARPDGGPVDNFEELVGHFDTRSRRKNFLLPAAVLRDNVNSRVGERLGRDQPIFHMGHKVFVDEVRRHAGAEAGRVADHVFVRLKRLPTRVQAASPWTSKFLSRHDFEVLYADVNELYRALGEPHDSDVKA